jgi:hypothetical protein
MRVAGEQAPAAGRFITAGGAALGVMVALAGCADTGVGPRDTASVSDVAPGGDGGPDADATAQPEYGVSPDGTVQDATTQPEYGVSPDGYAEDATAQPEYGVSPDAGPLLDVGPAGDVTDAGMPDGTVIDCDAVCCECEYGIIPDDVYEACCKPDPCANACCDCDYGDPPPPECCK